MTERRTFKLVPLAHERPSVLVEDVSVVQVDFLSAPLQDAFGHSEPVQFELGRPPCGVVVREFDGLAVVAVVEAYVRT